MSIVEFNVQLNVPAMFLCTKVEMSLYTDVREMTVSVRVNLQLSQSKYIKIKQKERVKIYEFVE